MTVEQARKILKLSRKEVSDEEIEKIIELLRELARLYLN
jgi:Asp-tRNA(Asn)/Glu-tRNA(Gln) amidotransferase C subunit